MKNLLVTTGVFVLLGINGCNNAKKEDYHDQNANDSVAVATGGQITKESPPPQDSAAMAKAWTDFMTPGPMHRWMAAGEGKWNGELRSCTSPGGPLGAPSKLNVDLKMILNGLYQESTYKGDMMGMSFEGKGLMAYDNARKKFVSTWVDNMGSAVLHLEGDYDAGSKTLNMSGKSTDPLSGSEIVFREVVRMVDDKHQVMEMYTSSAGKEFKMMEITLAKI